MRRSIAFAGVVGLVAVATAAAVVAAPQRGGVAPPRWEFKYAPGPTRADLEREEAERLERLRYKGMKATVRPEVRGPAREVQEVLAQALNRADFVPRDRVEYFRGNKVVANATITGWWARILDATPAENGVSFTIKVGPSYVGDGATTFDSLTEHYFYSGGRLQYLGSVRPETRGVTVY